MTPEQRFWEKIEPLPWSGCWIWMGGLNDAGYGRIHGNSRAHRFAYELFVGPIPSGLELDHKCRVRCCVNPHHLEPVPHRVNVLRGDAGLYLKSRTHCPKGHEYTLENTITRTDRPGTRECKTCQRDRFKTPEARTRNKEYLEKYRTRDYVREKERQK